MAMVQIETKVPEEIRNKVAKIAGEIGLDIPTILRMSMYKIADEQTILPSITLTPKHNANTNYIKQKLQSRVKSGSSKIWKTSTSPDGVVMLPKDFPADLEETWDGKNV